MKYCLFLLVVGLTCITASVYCGPCGHGHGHGHHRHHHHHYRHGHSHGVDIDDFYSQYQVTGNPLGLDRDYNSGLATATVPEPNGIFDIEAFKSIIVIEKARSMTFRSSVVKDNQYLNAPLDQWYILCETGWKKAQNYLNENNGRNPGTHVKVGPGNYKQVYYSRWEVVIKEMEKLINGFNDDYAMNAIFYNDKHNLQELFPRGAGTGIDLDVYPLNNHSAFNDPEKCKDFALIHLNVGNMERPNGDADLSKALKRALTVQDKVESVVVITDGRPSKGDQATCTVGSHTYTGYKGGALKVVKEQCRKKVVVILIDSLLSQQSSDYQFLLDLANVPTDPNDPNTRPDLNRPPGELKMVTSTD